MILKYFLVLALIIASPLWAFEIQVGEAPGNDLSLTLYAISHAKRSIQLNAYELSSPDITRALIKQIEAGIKVDILQEGQPVGGLSKNSKKAQSLILQAMQKKSAKGHFYQMTAKAGGQRRYHYDHAKYAVIDGQELLVGSENYSVTGHPKPGKIGNRGWEVFIHDTAITREFQALFVKDSDPSNGDILDLTNDKSDQTLAESAANLSTLASTPSTGHTLQADKVVRITSPETSKSRLLKLIDEAQDHIEIEQMTFSSTWGQHGDETSPLYERILAAARRGVRVKVLMNDETVFNRGTRDSKPRNRITVELLNKTAKKENLKLVARIANLDAMGVDYIHNKGALFDNDRTVVSSINWNWNAVSNNREAGVVLFGQDVHDHYEELFQKDWEASAAQH